MKYKVKLEYIYSDTVEVEADSEKEAEELAIDLCQERYERYYDCNITLIED